MRGEYLVFFFFEKKTQFSCFFFLIQLIQFPGKKNWLGFLNSVDSIF